MKPRILGYAVLVYAALTSGVVLGIVRFILKKPGTDGWWTLGGAVLWLAYVSGGCGLILGRTWSRAVLLVTSAASAIVTILSPLVLLGSGLDLSLTSLTVVSSLPHVAIFVGALTLPPPEVRPFQPSPASVERLNLVYGCFSWIAFVLCATPLIPLLPLDSNTVQGLEMVVGLPIAMATLAIGLAGVVLSLAQWREWPLLTMSAITASILLVFLAEDEWKLVGKGVALAWYVGSTAVLIFFCARWFAFTRRRATQMQETDERGL